MSEIATLALTVRRLERIVTRFSQPCDYAEPAEPEVGDAGWDPCYIQIAAKVWHGDDHPCPRCSLRMHGHEHVRPALLLARRRFRYAADKEILKGCDDG